MLGCVTFLLLTISTPLHAQSFQTVFCWDVMPVGLGFKIQADFKGAVHSPVNSEFGLLDRNRAVLRDLECQVTAGLKELVCGNDPVHKA